MCARVRVCMCMSVLFILNYKHVTGLSMMHPGRNPSGRWGAEVLRQSEREREREKYMENRVVMVNLIHMHIWLDMIIIVYYYNNISYEFTQDNMENTSEGGK